MIRADQPVRVTALFSANARAAVAADVMEGPDLAVPVPQHDERILADRQRDVVARILDLARVADEEPIGGKDGLQIGLKHLLVDVERLREAVPLATLMEKGLHAVLHLAVCPRSRVRGFSALPCAGHEPNPTAFKLFPTRPSSQPRWRP